jgi:arylsulfatase A-like enzyme
MADRPPNVLLLLTDQERADLVAPDGLPVATPNLDRLREGGMWFDRAYTPTSICTSARASLLTGRYPHGHGLLNNSHGADAIRTTLDPSLPTVGRLLAEAGYEPTYAGKWHVDRARGPEGFGFEYVPSEGSEGNEGGDGGFHDAEDDVVIDESDLVDPIYTDEADPTLVAATTTVPPEETRTADLADRTIRAIRRWADGDRDGPSFHRTDFLGPHFPYVVPEAYADRYDPADVERWATFAETFEGKPQVHENYLHYRGVADFDWETWAAVVASYFGFVTFIDEQIGRVLDELDALGLTDGTAVVHASDHGDLTGSHRLFNKGPMMYEDTYRIPLIVRRPGAVEPGTRSDAFVRLQDLMPTFLDWADAEIPDGLHARSLRPLLAGDRPADWPDSVYAQYHGDEFGLYSQRMVRTDRYKFVYNAPDRNELYDLVEDPAELVNLIDHPAYDEERRALAERLTRWMRRVDDPLREWVPGTLP